MTIAQDAADLAVTRFARRLKEHPQIEADPVCVIATLEEQIKQEIWQGEVEEPSSASFSARVKPKPSKHRRSA